MREELREKLIVIALELAHLQLAMVHNEDSDDVYTDMNKRAAEVFADKLLDLIESQREEAVREFAENVKNYPIPDYDQDGDIIPVQLGGLDTSGGFIHKIIDDILSTYQTKSNQERV